MTARPETLCWDRKRGAYVGPFADAYDGDPASLDPNDPTIIECGVVCGRCSSSSDDGACSGDLMRALHGQDGELWDVEDNDMYPLVLAGYVLNLANGKPNATPIAPKQTRSTVENVMEEVETETPLEEVATDTAIQEVAVAIVVEEVTHDPVAEKVPRGIRALCRDLEAYVAGNLANITEAQWQQLEGCGSNRTIRDGVASIRSTGDPLSNARIRLIIDTLDGKKL